MIQVLVNTHMNSNYSTNPSSYENQVYRIMQTDWEQKLQKSSEIICKYVTQNKWYRFKNQNSHASYEYLHDEQVVMMIAGISDLICIFINQNTSYRNSILSYLVQHHMNQ